MNFQERNRTVFGMVRQSTIFNLEQKEIQVCLEEMEKMK